MKSRRAIWDTSYGHAMLKLERADQHIEQFKSRIFASEDRYGVSQHFDLNTGEAFLHYVPRDYMIQGELSAIAGDAIHNIRSALDIAWLGIRKELGGPISEHAKFPINPDGVKAWLEGALAKTSGIDPTSRLYDFLVNHVKGYKGGDPDILALHSLDIDDKHKLLIPMVQVTGIKGIELEHEDGRIEVLDVTLNHREIFRRVIPLETKLKKNGHVHFEITFGEGTGFEGLNMLDTIHRWKRKVWELIRWLHRIK